MADRVTELAEWLRTWIYAVKEPEGQIFEQAAALLEQLRQERDQARKERDHLRSRLGDALSGSIAAR